MNSLAEWGKGGICLDKPQLRSWHYSFQADVFGFQYLIENSLRTYLA
jgi:hypothetical protein